MTRARLHAPRRLGEVFHDIGGASVPWLTRGPSECLWWPWSVCSNGAGECYAHNRTRLVAIRCPAHLGAAHVRCWPCWRTPSVASAK